MSNRAIRASLAAGLALCASASTALATETVTHPYPGITLIQRTEIRPLPAPNANPNRQVKMNIVLIDLSAPEVRFKFTPPTAGLPGQPGQPPAVCPTPVFGVPWYCPAPPMEVVRRSTLQALGDAHGQVAINSHFFAPFPVVNTPQGQAQAGFAYLIGFAASRGNVYSAFENSLPPNPLPPVPPNIPQLPVQVYAIMPDSPAVNIDPDNQASIVHRDPAFADGLHVLEPVTVWNALAGSGQIITNGVKTIPCYVPATGCSLVGPGNGANGGYSNSNSWYNLVNARTAIGIIPAGGGAPQKLVLFTVDISPNVQSNPNRSQGMRVPEVADVLLEYGVSDALNLDGGGSTSMAMQDVAPTNGEYLRRFINASSDGASGRAEASNLAVYSDGIDPASTAAAVPAPNANGWNREASITVSLDATDERSGNTGNLPGWVDQLQYALDGAQTAPETVAPGHAASVAVTAEGITTVTYSATDAAGNREGDHEHVVRIDRTRPDINGLPGECLLWPPNHEMVQVAVVSASDALSGVADGALQVTAESSDHGNSHDPDTAIVPDGAGGYAVWLRAERRGNGDGRLYTIEATATDRAGNSTTATATCVVPHDMGND